MMSPKNVSRGKGYQKVTTGNKGEGVVKNLKKEMASFMNAPEQEFFFKVLVLTVEEGRFDGFPNATLSLRSEFPKVFCGLFPDLSFCRPQSQNVVGGFFLELDQDELGEFVLELDPNELEEGFFENRKRKPLAICI